MQHPITPTPELVKDWCASKIHEQGKIPLHVHVATQAARWGADQELKACCEWLREAKNHGFGYDYGSELARRLRIARRPKPPSLKEKGLKALAKLKAQRLCPELADEIRDVLEALPDE